MRPCRPGHWSRYSRPLADRDPGRHDARDFDRRFAPHPMMHDFSIRCSDEIEGILIDDLPIYYMTMLKKFTAFDKKVGGPSALKGGDLLTQNNVQVVSWFISQ